ncbi:phosphatase PAP2 family protein [Nocardiopsis coralliicola]
MDVVWGAESSAVRWVQSWGAWLEPPMHAVSALGSQAFAIAVLPLLFWSVHPALGARLCLVVLGSASLNGVLKSVLGTARPFWFDPGVQPHAHEATFGAPSGHAQNSAAAWGYLAAQTADRRWWAGAAAVVALICLSRIYLGVHFPSDILIGLAVGVLLLWAVLRWERPVLRWWLARTLPAQLGLSALAGAAPVAAVAAQQALFRAPWTAPREWAGAVPPDLPGEAVASAGTSSAALIGVLAGLSLLHHRGWYSADGSLITRAARYVTGVIGVVLITAALRVAVPDGAGAAGDALTAGAVAVWAALGAPELFLRLGMAERPGPAAAPAGAAGRSR